MIYIQLLMNLLTPTPLRGTQKSTGRQAGRDTNQSTNEWARNNPARL